jgi:ComF family protein
MFTSLINLFFPEVCAGCGGFLLTGEHVICTNCRHELPMTNHHLLPENEAFQKFYGKLPVEFVATLFYFHKKGIVQEMIHKLKYKGQQQIGTVIGHWYAEDLKKIAILRQVDAIIPVPLHKKRLRQRGYNQVTAFGKALSESLEIPFDDSLLVRNVYSKSQTKKNRSGRSKNSQSVFGIAGDVSHENKHYLLIDDVLTTGATLEACGNALLELKGIKLSIICIAMTK